MAAAPKPPVIALHRQRLERTLKSTSAPEPMTIAPAPETKSHSRKAKGECGQRIGRKIDRLLEEIVLWEDMADDDPDPFTIRAHRF